MNKDHNGLVTKNDYGNIEAKSFVHTVDLFKELKDKGEDTSEIKEVIERALSSMHVGNGIYKNHPDYPHPKMDKTNKRYMDKEIFNAILTYYSITKQFKKINDIRRAARFFLFYDNTDSKQLKPVGLLNALYLIFLLIKRIFN